MVGMRLRDLLRRIAALSVQLCHGEAFRGDRRSVSACMDASLASPWRTAFSAILTAAGFYGPFIHLQQRLPTCPRFFSSTAPTIFFRAFHGLPDLRTSSGEPTGAVRGFLGMLGKVWALAKPDHAVIIFDAQGKNFRHEMFPDAKEQPSADARRPARADRTASRHSEGPRLARRFGARRRGRRRDRDDRRKRRAPRA